MRNRVSGALCLLAFLAGCGASERPRGNAPEPPAGAQKLHRAIQSPTFVATANDGNPTATAAAAADAAARFARGVTPGDRGVERLEAAAAPILYNSPEGVRFLAADGPRAFAIGQPPETCPARASGVGATPASAAEAALSGCLAQLDAARSGGARDCGCSVLALGDLVFGLPESLGYAPGVSAHIAGPNAGDDLYLIAEEAPGEDGERLVLFRAPGASPIGPVAAAIAPDGAARLLWREPDPEGAETMFSGRRIADGLRRGRFAERLYLENAAGRRLVALIGYEPVEYAVRRRELLAWPQS